jgi:Ca-activated chloride channel family protein
VTLRRATSISPTLALLEPHPAEAAGHALHLGGIEQGKSINVLLELLAPPAPATDTPTRRLRLARLQASSEELPAAALDLVATYSALPAEPPDAVLDAAARANAARMQRRALEAAANGEREQAVSLLRAVAERLHDLGEPGLAHIALQEAESLEQTGQTTRLGAKELTYATRRLGKG